MKTQIEYNRCKVLWRIYSLAQWLTKGRQGSLPLLLAVCLGWCGLCPAQNEQDMFWRGKNEISAGIGFGTIMQLRKLFKEDDKWPTPSMHVQYLHNVSNRIGLGLAIDYAYCYYELHREIIPKYNERNRFIGAYVGDKLNTKWLTVSPVARFYWFDKGYFAMYSRFGVGVLFASGRDSGTYFMPNLSPVALEWGSKQVRFCIEPASVGSLGMFNGSLKYSF